jgi:hypothetical protein
MINKVLGDSIPWSHVITSILHRLRSKAYELMQREEFSSALQCVFAVLLGAPGTEYLGRDPAILMLGFALNIVRPPNFVHACNVHNVMGL